LGHTLQSISLSKTKITELINAAPKDARTNLILAPLYDSITQGIWTVTIASAYWFTFVLNNPTPVNLDQVNYKKYFTAGTWSFTIIHMISFSNAIMDIIFDGSVIASIDAYSAITVNNFVTTISGIVINTDGYKILSVKANGKNPASTNYLVRFNFIQAERTS
jgi:hypothetical protein